MLTRSDVLLGAASLTGAAALPGCGGGTTPAQAAGASSTTFQVTQGAAGPMLVANGGEFNNVVLVSTDLGNNAAMVYGHAATSITNPTLPNFTFLSNGQFSSADGKLDGWAQMSADHQYLSYSLDGNKSSTTIRYDGVQVASRAFQGTLQDTRNAQQVLAPLCSDQCMADVTLALAASGYFTAAILFTATPAGWVAVGIAGAAFAWEVYYQLSHK